MIKLTDNLWIGNSADEQTADLVGPGIGAILNVAQDLRATRGWGGKDRAEYMQVGLIDGPGNPLATYCAATLALYVLLKRSRVLVCCHTGSRALTIAVMLVKMNTLTRVADSRGWDDLLAILQERVEGELPAVHKAHREAFDKIPWGRLSSMLGD